MAIKTTVTVNVAALEVSDVMSVYSGINGKCCCGCAGTHSYSTQHQAAASKDRGYKVDDDELNDKMVKRVLGIVQKSASTEQGDGEWVSTVISGRLYVVYLTTRSRKGGA